MSIAKSFGRFAKATKIAPARQSSQTGKAARSGFVRSSIASEGAGTGNWLEHVVPHRLLSHAENAKLGEDRARESPAVTTAHQGERTALRLPTVRPATGRRHYDEIR